MRKDLKLHNRFVCIKSKYARKLSAMLLFRQLLLIRPNDRSRFDSREDLVHVLRNEIREMCSTSNSFFNHLKVRQKHESQSVCGGFELNALGSYTSRNIRKKPAFLSFLKILGKLREIEKSCSHRIMCLQFLECVSRYMMGVTQDDQVHISTPV